MFKLSDFQRADVKVTMSSCQWRRNTLTWQSSKALVDVREDKYGHLKRMMLRENRVKLKLKKGAYDLSKEIKSKPKKEAEDEDDEDEDGDDGDDRKKKLLRQKLGEPKTAPARKKEKTELDEVNLVELREGHAKPGAVA